MVISYEHTENFFVEWENWCKLVVKGHNNQNLQSTPSAKYLNNIYLEQELVLGEPLHGFEEVGGEGQLVAELLLAAQQDGMVVPHLRQRALGALHVLTIPAARRTVLNHKYKSFVNLILNCQLDYVCKENMSFKSNCNCFYNIALPLK